MSGEAQRDADGVCSLVDYDGRIEGTWASLARWADAWVAESREDTCGPATSFAFAMSYERAPWQLEAVVALVDAAGEDDLAVVGAGPLEDLIGDQPISDGLLAAIDALARRSRPFQQALSNVWLTGEVPDGPRRRLAELGARDFVAERELPQERLKDHIADRDARGLGWG